MRVILAGLYIFIGMFIVAAGVINALPKNSPDWIMGALICIGMLGLITSAFFLFNRPGAKALGNVDPEDYIRGLEDKNLISQESYKAKRAFQLEEFEDEGSHYYIELENGTVLYMNGQYLYDYEPITDDHELNQPRSFPCTDFTIKYHSKKDFVVAIECCGNTIEPEVVAPSFSKTDYKQGSIPEDRSIITDKCFDDILSERMAGYPLSGPRQCRHLNLTEAPSAQGD